MKIIKALILVLFVFGFCITALAETNPKWSSQIGMNPPSPSAGQTVKFTATLWVKLGPVDNLKIIGGVDGMTIFNKTYNHCPKQFIEELTFTWVAEAGTHKAWFQIDPDETTPDINRSDNRTEIQITVPSGNEGGSSPGITFTFTRKARRTLTLTTPTNTNTIGLRTDLQITDPCIKNMHEQTDLILVNFSISAGSNPDERNFTATIKNIGPRCVENVSWFLNRKPYNMGEAIPPMANGITEQFSISILTGAIIPEPGSSWSLKAGDQKTVTGKIKKSNFNLNQESCKQTSAGPCSEVQFFIDLLKKIPETNEHNNESLVNRIHWD